MSVPVLLCVKYRASLPISRQCRSTLSALLAAAAIGCIITSLVRTSTVYKSTPIGCLAECLVYPTMMYSFNWAVSLKMYNRLRFADRELGKPLRMLGGGARNRFHGNRLEIFVENANDLDRWQSREYSFEFQCEPESVQDTLARHKDCISCLVPLKIIVNELTKKELIEIGKMHKVWVPVRLPIAKAVALFSDHECGDCARFVSIFADVTPQGSRANIKNTVIIRPPRERRKGFVVKSSARLAVDSRIMNDIVRKLKMKRKKYTGRLKHTAFPPVPLSNKEAHSIVSRHCSTVSPASFIEHGCAVCGWLVPRKALTPLSSFRGNLNLLVAEGVTRKERFSTDDPIEDLDGPVLADGCSRICVDCETSLMNGVVPKLALARHNWVGTVPTVLQNLTYAENILIARIRHNRCVVRVTSGRVRMRANAIMFAQPMLKVYHRLPPSRDELSEILAFVFTGSAAPTPEEFDRTPMLVRRNKVLEALEWLKLNHEGYRDLEISMENLMSYPERGIPVVVDFRNSRRLAGDPDPVSEGGLAVNEVAEELGTSTGECTFAVHGLTGEEYWDASMTTIKAVALQHLMNDGKILGIGRAKEPESMYHNVASYPGMFPWLFPYGKGGIGHPSHNHKQADLTRKRSLLMYFDKRFQMDTYFPMIAFNHEQMKGSATGSKLLAKRAKFGSIARRLRAINPLVAEDIANRLVKGDHVVPVSDAEKICFDLIRDLDGIAGHVKGSVTSKKYMRNEIWSTISFFNAPTWFVTISWSDLHHPLALYYAQTDTVYRPELRTSDERKLLMSKNPVAAARFFHYMVNAFLTDVLGWESEQRGLFGHTNAFYGTVEQQGRLTLHLHLLLWIVNAMSPQEIRDRIMSHKSKFRMRLIRYLESCHQAELFEGKISDGTSAKKPLGNIDSEDDIQSSSVLYDSPTHTFAKPPPPMCTDGPCDLHCRGCVKLARWGRHFRSEVDDLWKRSNVHDHHHSIVDEANKEAKRDWKGDKRKKGKKMRPVPSKLMQERNGCLTKTGICRARFPRDMYETSEVDQNGHLNIRHIEPMMNTVSPILTYVSRCNTDVTSLLSGTAVKAVVSYVSDYISKLSLKTYQMFASVYHVFEKESESIGGDVKEREQARHMMRKMVNSMPAKMEIGSPMASMYVLGHPDHYPSHKYVAFSWRSYVMFIRSFWTPHIDNDVNMEENEEEESVPIGRQDGQFVATSGVDDYRYRPVVYNNVSLYEWIQCYDRKARTKQEKADFYQEILVSKYLDHTWQKAAASRLAEAGELYDEDDLLEDEFDLDDGEYLDPRLTVESSMDVDDTYVSDWETDDEDQVIMTKQIEMDKVNKPVRQAFTPGHPLFLSHAVTCDFTKINTVIPNFIGGAVPRADKGDRSYYCLAMLTLFKPWRSPADLKDAVSTWEQAFKEYDFTARQRELLSNFNVRYECNDARDDHFAALKKKIAEARTSPHQVPSNLMGDTDPFIDDLRNCDYDSGEESDDDNLDHDVEKGPRTRRIEAEASEIQRVAISSGWMNKCSDHPTNSNRLPDRLIPPAKSRQEWAKLIKSQRMQFTVNKLANMPPADERDGQKREVDTGVQELTSVYFNADIQIDAKGNADIQAAVIKQFDLNPEQCRAFAIVADHASSPKKLPLRMYLGGMGGTGKSQVLNAIVAFFVHRKEEYRYMILGPTGSTAALLGGSTYHSVFRIPRESKSKNREDLDGIRNETAAVAAVNERLQGVEYIFLDEISMVSCNDFQLLATQAAKARNVHDEAFGGLNVIVAGDFAQLPPMTGPSLYSGAVALSVGDAKDIRNQNAVLGKILWHQFNTVVILRRNMRQKDQTPADDKMRTALINMRYGACTEEDIAFLESRIAGFRPEDPKISSAEYRNVSIITARNSQKDALNRMGADRFAQDTGQELTHFCSVDRLSSRAVDKSKWKSCQASDVKHIGSRLRRSLWNALPSTTSEFVAGTLSLCIGMPVMLRSNDATELCMTKGQEAIVVGWDSFIGPHGQNVLDTLFVRLVKPPRNVQIDDLPENVVPLTRTVTHVTVLLEDDSLLSILREQVVLLLNFGMTDYTSQGKSRPVNSVDPTHCRDHRSVYVALSRGTAAESTVMLQNFDRKKITSGMSGYLRQELRELELLDEITTLRYEGKLPSSVTGIYRRRLLRSYYAWHADHRDPPHFHEAMRWDKSMGPRIPPAEKIDERRPSNTQKRKRPAAENIDSRKKIKTSHSTSKSVSSANRRRVVQALPAHARRPIGFIWDSRDHSCAYDSTLTVLANIWAEHKNVWHHRFSGIGPMMTLLDSQLRMASAGLQTLEESRNVVRRSLHLSEPAWFPYGPNPSSIDRVWHKLLPAISHGKGRQSCSVCGYMDPVDYDVLYAHMSAGLSTRMPYPDPVPLSTWLQNIMSAGRNDCPSCALQRGQRQRLKMLTRIVDIPPVLVFDIDSSRLSFDPTLLLERMGTVFKLHLRGVVYGGHGHFTCRYIDRYGKIWFNDGITTGRACIPHGTLADIEDLMNLHSCVGSSALAVVYALE